MEEFKRRNFAKNHPGVSPPLLRQLNKQEMSRTQAVLARKLGLPAEVDSLTLTRQLLSVETLLPDLNTIKQFNLQSALQHCGIQANQTVFINWYRFDQIDEIALDDLVLYFDDIWYPSSDDIDVFDQSYAWVFSVEHNGAVRVVQFS